MKEPDPDDWKVEIEESSHGMWFCFRWQNIEGRHSSYFEFLTHGGEWIGKRVDYFETKKEIERILECE